MQKVKTALIVSSAAETRKLLSHTLERSSLAIQAVTAPSENEALKTLEASKSNFQVIFLGKDLELNKIALFIEAAKKIPASSGASYIALKNAKEMVSSTVSGNMMIGVHAFLSEPFTIDTLEQALELSRGVSLQHSKARIRAATGLMLHSAKATKDGQNYPISHGNLWDEVQESCKRYREITGDSVTTAVVSAIHRMKPTKRLTSYNGVSKRVKQLFETKFKPR